MKTSQTAEAATRSGFRSSIKTEAYLVQVPHVRVRLKIRQSVADALLAQTPFIQSRLGSDVYASGLPALFASRTGAENRNTRHAKSLASIYASIHGFKCAEITLDFDRHQWELLKELSSLLHEPVEHLIRGLLADRANNLKRFSHVAKGGPAA
ncbi:MAG TPA: hypothetical protein VFG14_16480 [Chthoniobacteraceae bacterium]|nr:hypothetical protein [Chthoniobacteraceae bacterium]